MEKFYYIGHKQNNENDLKLDDPSVSRRHLKVKKINDETIFVEDLDSVNGTYLDDIRIISKNVKKGQILKLGSKALHTDEIFAMINRKVIGDRLDYTTEYSLVLRYAEQYHAEVSKLDKKITFWQTTIGKFILPVTLTVLAIYGLTLIKLSLNIALIIGTISGFLSSFIVGKIFDSEGMQDQKALISKKYESFIKCPNPECKMSLIKERITVLRTLERCSRCHAKYKKHDLV